MVRDLSERCLNRAYGGVRQMSIADAVPAGPMGRMSVDVALRDLMQFVRATV